MIASIKGKVIGKSLSSTIIVETSGGVGYEIFVTTGMIARVAVGAELTLSTFLAVRETAFELYGFGSIDERELFLKLVSVSGIGPKTAMHILELGEVSEIAAAIGRGDVAYLTRVSGIGKKTAERAVVELKSKMAAWGSGVGAVFGAGMLGDAADALESLGYSQDEIREALQNIKDKDTDSGKIVKEALKMLGRK
jgi:Holliday junction DNA helicase RuvA